MSHLKMMGTYLIYLTTLLTLSGCTTKEFHFGWYDKCLPKTLIKIQKVLPPLTQDDLNCSEIPKPPTMTKQSEVSNYIVDLTVAGKDCKNALDYVKISINKFEQENNESK